MKTTIERVQDKHDKTETVVREFEFLRGNEKWGGRVQVLRVQLRQPDGTVRTFINKRLLFNNSGRYMNLPRAGVEELVTAILDASDVEKALHEALLEDLNPPRSQNRSNNGPRESVDRRREAPSRR